MQSPFWIKTWPEFSLLAVTQGMKCRLLVPLLRLSFLLLLLPVDWLVAGGEQPSSTSSSSSIKVTRVSHARGKLPPPAGRHSYNSPLASPLPTPENATVQSFFSRRPFIGGECRNFLLPAPTIAFFLDRMRTRCTISNECTLTNAELDAELDTEFTFCSQAKVFTLSTVSTETYGEKIFLHHFAKWKSFGTFETRVFPTLCWLEHNQPTVTTNSYDQGSHYWMFTILIAITSVFLHFYFSMYWKTYKRYSKTTHLSNMIQSRVHSFKQQL